MTNNKKHLETIRRLRKELGKTSREFFLDKAYGGYTLKPVSMSRKVHEAIDAVCDSVHISPQGRVRYVFTSQPSIAPKFKGLSYNALCAAAAKVRSSQTS